MPNTSSHGLRLGVFGNEGSFTEEAGLTWARSNGMEPGEDFELRHLVDAGGLLIALEKERIDRAVLPIHNTAAGLVPASLQALSGRSFRVAGQVALTVQQCLCLRSDDVERAAIAAVASHPHALEQCAGTLDSLLPDAQRVAWSDTASAARDLAVGVLPAANTAVLASRRAAERFDLHVWVEHAEDEPDNRTTFVVLEREA